MILTTVNLLFNRDFQDPKNNYHNKIYQVIMQLSTINRTIKILYHLIGTDTVP